MPDLSAHAWLIALAAALCTGLSKSGFGPFGLLAILLMAEVLPARESTGVILPLLIPATCIGIVTGWWIMPKIPAEFFGHTLGWIILALIGVIVLQRSRPQLLTAVTSHPLLGIGCGWAAGITTMIANAAGPITAFYFLSQQYTKMVMVGTGAWFYFAINVAKLPFSWQLGLLNPKSLLLDLILLPSVFLGFWIGRSFLKKISQNLFEWILILMAFGASLRMILK
ncbi:sulfite exporter TauE/SafE family protein [bacterium]|nr:sulfite exporter TauE/SafE family protein [bacterium]